MDSKLGRRPIPVPASVEIDIKGSEISFKGPKGYISLDIPEPILINHDVEAKSIKVNRVFETKESKTLQGTYSSHIKNAIHGVDKEFTIKLLLVGTGYRINQLEPAKLKLLLGFSHDVFFDAPEGISFEVPNSTELVIKGVNKQAVGQVAANIYRLRPVEPYKGKGFRYDGVNIELKEVNKK